MTVTASSPALRRPDGAPLRVLVVDDEQMLTDLLSMALRMEGWDVRAAASGFQALQAARDFEPDAMVLDIMMPDLDGMAVLQRLRQSGNDVPVLFLTAKDAVSDRVAGLTAGGDDYVTKPFSLEEVVARLRGLMRRAGTALASDAEPILRVADLSLNEDSHEVERSRRADRADRDGVRAAALPHAQPAPRRVEGADPRPRLELRLRRTLERRRALHLVPAQEDRSGPRAAHPHGARRRLHDQSARSDGRTP